MAYGDYEDRFRYGQPTAPQVPPPPPAVNPAAPPAQAAPPPPPQAPQAPAAPDMSGFQGAGGYDRWAAANRAAGGTGDRAAFNQQMGLAAPPPPPGVQGTQRPGGAVPPPPPNQFHVGQGRADGTSGGQNALANMTEEQRIEHSMQNIDSLDAHGDANRAREQWKIWQRSYDPACPDQFPYQAEDGSGCVEKPDNSNNPGAGGRQNLPGGGGRGGGGRGGQGGRGGAGGAGGAGLEGRANRQIWEQIKKDLMGGPSRYSDEAMARLEADQFARARRQEELQLGEARRDAALRGVSRSGGQGAALRDIRSGTGQAILTNRANLQREKIKADFEDRQAAIQNSQKWLNSLRDYMLRTDMNAIQREQLAAQIRMAEKQLSWQTAENDRAYQRNISTRLIFDPNSPV